MKTLYPVSGSMYVSLCGTDLIACRWSAFAIARGKVLFAAFARSSGGRSASVTGRSATHLSCCRFFASSTELTTGYGTAVDDASPRGSGAQKRL